MGYSPTSNGIALLAIFSSAFIAAVLFHFTQISPPITPYHYSLESYAQYLPPDVHLSSEELEALGLLDSTLINYSRW